MFGKESNAHTAAPVQNADTVSGHSFLITYSFMEIGMHLSYQPQLVAFTDSEGTDD